MTNPRRWPRLALSATDLALLIVMATLVSAHLRSALGGSLVSLLFGAQHLAILIVTLLHRPADKQRVPPTELLLAWAGTLLPLAMRSSTENVINLGLILIIPGSVFAQESLTNTKR